MPGVCWEERLFGRWIETEERSASWRVSGSRLGLREGFVLVLEAWWLSGTWDDEDLGYGNESYGIFDADQLWMQP